MVGNPDIYVWVLEKSGIIKDLEYQKADLPKS